MEVVQLLPDMSLKPFPIVLAPTGMVPTKEQNRHVPITPKEIAEDVRRCAEIGLTSVHVHARDSAGEPDWRIETYREIVSEVKTLTPEILINVSTSGRTWSEVVKRADCLALEGDLKPDFASLTLSSLNFLTGPSINAPDTIFELARIMQERGITPELEIFDLGMVNMAQVLKRKGLLPERMLANLFFGNIYGAQPTLIEMGTMIAGLPSGAIWSGAGIGRSRDAVHAVSLGSGGGVRVGLEDGIYLNPEGDEVASNAQLVERVHEMAGLLGRSFMKPSELKQNLAQA